MTKIETPAAPLTEMIYADRIEAKVQRILDRKMRQVAHKSEADQAAYRKRQYHVICDEMAIHSERAFVKACGFHSDGSLTLGDMARSA